MGRRKKQPYKSGYCMFAHGQYPCKGEYKNGELIKPPVTLCSCTCHGDYEARLVAAGQAPLEDIEDNDDE